MWMIKSSTAGHSKFPTQPLKCISCQSLPSSFVLPKFLQSLCLAVCLSFRMNTAHLSCWSFASLTTANFSNVWLISSFKNLVATNGWLKCLSWMIQLVTTCFLNRCCYLPKCCKACTRNRLNMVYLFQQQNSVLGNYSVNLHCVFAVTTLTDGQLLA